MAKKTTRTSPASTEEGGSLASRLVSALGPGVAGLASGPLESDVKHWLDSQVPLLNYVMGRPGYPEGRLITFKGKEGSCKSTLAYHALAETQRLGGLAILADVERTYDRERGARLGIDPDSLIVGYPGSLEECFSGYSEEGADGKERVKDKGLVATVLEQSRILCPNDEPITIVVDSLSTLKPRKEVEGGSSKQPATVASYMSKKLPLIIPQLAKKRVTLIIVNQLRVHIQDFNSLRNPERRKVMGEHWSMIAEQELIYFSSLILDFTAVGNTGEKDDPTGIISRVVVSKDKVGPGEGKRCEFDSLKLTGVDWAGSALEVLLALGIIKQEGGWLKYEQRPTGFRRSEFSQVLVDHPELAELVLEAPLLWTVGGQTAEEDKD